MPLDRDTLAERMALVDEYDGCFDRIREWEVLPQWERDAHPDERPHTDYEDREFWRKRADVALALVQPAAAKPIDRDILIATLLVHMNGKRVEAAADAVLALLARTDGVAVDREALRVAVQGVLWNASNYPPAVQSRMLGQDIAFLTTRVVDAVTTALAVSPTAEPLEEKIRSVEELRVGDIVIRQDSETKWPLVRRFGTSS